ncbi:MAG: hypothetical protein HW412_1379 [Bacteroidetes bacterium]|nr:hypothetical protein [Bacteroidota bacterium]
MIAIVSISGRTSASRKSLIDRYRFMIFLAVFALWDGPMLVFWILVWHAGEFPSFGFWVLWLGGCSIPFLLPASYYRLTSVEASGDLYKAIGIRFVKRWVTHGDRMNRWIRRRDPAHRVIRNRGSLRGFFKKTVFVERWHLAMLVISIGTSLYAAVIGWYFWSVYLLVANIAVNLYPVLLQRYSRARLLRLEH